MSQIRWVVGVDEAGRGPLAGPVSVAAIAVRADRYSTKLPMFDGVRDSKKLTEHARNEWYGRLKQLEKKRHVRSAVSLVGNTIIDKKGIMYAVRLGVLRSLRKLNIPPSSASVLLDGSLYAPEEWINQNTIVRGDDRVQIISAASVLAKVRRDRRMSRLAQRYPAYGLEIHKGYGTKDHIRALRQAGLSEIHRHSFCRFLPKSVS